MTSQKKLTCTSRWLENSFCGRHPAAAAQRRSSRCTFWYTCRTRGTPTPTSRSRPVSVPAGLCDTARRTSGDDRSRLAVNTIGLQTTSCHREHATRFLKTTVTKEVALMHITNVLYTAARLQVAKHTQAKHVHTTMNLNKTMYDDRSCTGVDVGLVME